MLSWRGFMQSLTQVEAPGEPSVPRREVVGGVSGLAQRGLP
jgi:hypothetical protein